jgi:hypothetical protein
MMIPWFDFDLVIHRKYDEIEIEFPAFYEFREVVEDWNKNGLYVIDHLDLLNVFQMKNHSKKTFPLILRKTIMQSRSRTVLKIRGSASKRHNGEKEGRERNETKILLRSPYDREKEEILCKQDENNVEKSGCDVRFCDRSFYEHVASVYPRMRIPL